MQEKTKPVYAVLYFPKNTEVKHYPKASGLVVIEPAGEESLKVKIYSRTEGTTAFAKMIRSALAKSLRDNKTILTLIPRDCITSFEQVFRGSKTAVNTAVLSGIIHFDRSEIPAKLTELGEQLYGFLRIPEELERETTLKEDLVYGLSVLSLFLKEDLQVNYKDEKEIHPPKRTYFYTLKGIPAEFVRVVSFPKKVELLVQEFFTAPEKEVVEIPLGNENLVFSGTVNLIQAKLEQVKEETQQAGLSLSSELKLRSRECIIYPTHIQTPFNEVSLDLTKAFLEFLSNHTKTPLIKFIGFKERIEEEFFYPFVLKTFRVNPYNYDYFQFVIDLYRGDTRKWSFLIQKPEVKISVPEETGMKDRERIIRNYFTKKIDEFVKTLPLPASVYEIKKTIPSLIEKTLAEKTTVLIEKSILLLYTLSTYVKPVVDSELTAVLFPEDEGFTNLDRRKWDSRIEKLKEIALESLAYLSEEETSDLKEIGKVVVQHNLSLYISQKERLSTVELLKDPCKRLLGSVCSSFNKKLNLSREYIQYSLEKVLKQVRNGELGDIIKQRLKEKRNFLAVFLEMFKEMLMAEEQYEVENYEIEISDSLDCELYSYHIIK